MIMKGIREFFNKVEKKEGGIALLQRLCGRNRRLYEALAFSGLLAGPLSEKISFEQSLQMAKGWEEKGMQNQAVAWWLIAVKRAIFKDRGIFKECLKRYETLSGKRLLPEEMVDQAMKVAAAYYQSQQS